MTVLFSNSSPKIPKSGIFGPKFRHFCFFVKFCKQTNLRVLISNRTVVFLKILPKNPQIRHCWSKYPNKAFLFPNSGIFVSSKILQFEGADFKYEIIFLKILAQKYPNTVFLVKNTQIRHFQSQIQAFLFLRKIQELDKFEGADFKYDNIFFKFQHKNTQIRHIWSEI